MIYGRIVLTVKGPKTLGGIQCPQFLEKQIWKILIIRNYQIPSTFRHMILSVELIALIKSAFSRIDPLSLFFSRNFFQSSTDLIQNCGLLQNRYIFPKAVFEKFVGYTAARRQLQCK